MLIITLYHYITLSHIYTHIYTYIHTHRT